LIRLKAAGANLASWFSRGLEEDRHDQPSPRFRSQRVGKIKATIADGVLKVVAPHRTKAEPQNIEVQAGA
jgi:hypothetical protein